MTALVVVIFAVLAVSLGFLMWASLRAMGVAVRLGAAESAEFSKVDRRLFRIVAFGSPLLMLTGALVGIALRPYSNIYKSELIGCAVTGVIWLGAMTVLAVRVATHKRRAE